LAQPVIDVRTVIPRERHPLILQNFRGLKPGEAFELVDRAAKAPETDPDSLAFTLMMIRLDGCIKCHEGSFKYMRGCQVCAVQTVMQFKGTDADLLVLYQKALHDTDAYLKGYPVVEDEVEEEIETPPDGEQEQLFLL
jgi:hypothetical protein